MSGRQPLSALRQADEIKMKFEDIDRIIDYIKEFPDKTIIYEIPKDTINVDWQLLEIYSKEVTLVCALHDLRLIPKCKEFNLKYYWAYPITSYYELRGIIALEPYYLFIGAPLTFDLERVHNMSNALLRICPNVAYDAYIPRADGICGSWVRPDDVRHYEPYVNTFEFITDGLEKERTLLKIYKEDGTWPDSLNILITNLKVDVDNRAIPDEFGPLRLRCGQRCMQNGSCHYCHSAIKFSEAVRNKYLEMQKKDEN
jgi:hypothetical protein